MRAQDEHQPQRSHRQPPDQRPREQPREAGRPQQRAERDAGGIGGHRAHDHDRDGPARTIRACPNPAVWSRRDRVPVRARGSRAGAVRDLAAVRDRGQRGRPARPGAARHARAVGDRGARAAGGAGPRAARGGGARERLPAGLRASAAGAAARRASRPSSRGCGPRRPSRSRGTLRWAYEGRAMPPAARALLADPQAGMDRLAAVMTAYWRRAIEPVWPAIRATLEADIAYRAGRLAAGGPLAAFADLHPSVAWRDGALEVDRDHEATVELGGRGLLLVPAAFAWPDLWAMIDPPWQPAIVYAPRGVADAVVAGRARARGARGPARPPPRAHPGRPGRARLHAGARPPPLREPGRDLRAPRRAAARGTRRGSPRRPRRPLRPHAGGRLAGALGLAR